MKKLIIGVFIFLLIGIVFHQKEKIFTESDEGYVAPTRPLYTDDRQWQRMLMKGGKIEPEKMMKGRKIVEERIAKFKKTNNEKDGGLRSWVNFGPSNIGGRVRAIALQPTSPSQENIYVGGAGGGLWRSTNGGVNWTLNNDINYSLAITSIAVAQSDPDILYASTGEGHVSSTIGIPGAGIFKSTDGGDNWSQLSSTDNDQFYWCNKLAVHPTNANNVFVVTSNVDKDNGTFGLPFNGGGVLKESTNGGATWTDIATGSILTDIEIHPDDADVRIAAGHGTLLVYNSANGTWEEKVTGNANELPDDIDGRIEVAMAKSSPNVVYALANVKDAAGTARLYRSFNGGDTWSLRLETTDFFTSSTFGNYANTLFIDPLNFSNVYVGGLDLWRSTSGGPTFTKISDWTQYHTFINADVDVNIQPHADHHIMIPSLYYSSTNKKVYIGNDGGIQKTDDISLTNTGLLSEWDNLLGSGIGLTQFYGASVSPHTGQFAGGTQDNGILMDLGGGFNDWEQPSTGDGSQVLFHPADPNIVYATVNYNKLLKSTDAGQSFITVAELGAGNSFLVGPSAIDPTLNNHVYLGGKELWRYDDGTGMLTVVKAAIPSGAFITKIEIDDQRRAFWLGYADGTVEYSETGGSSWSGDISFIGQGSPPNAYVTDIDIRPFGPDALDALVTFGGYTQENVWRVGENAGTHTWDNIALDFDMQVNTITHHPTQFDWIYIGTDVGVFASENNGDDWSTTPTRVDLKPEFSNEGPTYTEVTDLFWYYNSAQEVNRLCAATFGRGIYRSFSVMPEAYVDRTHVGPYLGTFANPYDEFLDAESKTRRSNAPIIFLEGGTYNEITSPRLFDQRIHIKSQASNGAIIE